MSIFITYMPILLNIQLECMAYGNGQNATKIYKLIDT